MAENNIVTIKPKQGSHKFYSTAVQYRVTESQDGKPRDEQAGAYKGERFPNSRQIKRVKYSYGKRKWMLEGFEENSQELNKLVSECKLRYPKDHPKEAQMIQEADIYDLNDPFFTHKQLFIRQSEGEFKLDKKRSFDFILLQGLKKDYHYQVGANSKGIMSSRVKHIITDKNLDHKDKKEQRDRTIKITQLFSALSYEKKKKIAEAMNIIRGGDIDPETLDDVMWNNLTTNADNKPLGESKAYADLFIDLCEGSNESLEIKHLMSVAKKHNFLRYQRKEGWLLFGINIGKKISEVEDYFLDEKNQDVIARLEKSIEDAN